MYMFSFQFRGSTPRSVKRGNPQDTDFGSRYEFVWLFSAAFAADIWESARQETLSIRAEGDTRTHWLAKFVNRAAWTALPFRMARSRRASRPAPIGCGVDKVLQM